MSVHEILFAERTYRCASSVILFGFLILLPDSDLLTTSLLQIGLVGKELR